ncbi:MAG: hypothetical protein VX498_11530 [Myxococcota bacterium]|nr:hypothetical protein [Myxococcota bacterium]
MRAGILLLASTALALLGCGPQFALFVDGEEGGMLLSAWTDGDQVLAVGGQLDDTGGLLVERRDEGWCSDDSIADRPAWWIHGSEPGRWFAVGAAGLILHHEDGTTVDESVETDATFYGVWDEGDRVWAVGGDVWGDRLGDLWLREDGSWQLVDDQFPGVLFKMWENWIVGDGVAYQVLADGSLESRPLPGAEKLVTVRGRSETDVWAVGGLSGALVMHWNGSEWTSVPVDPFCTSQPLNGVWTAPGEEVWIAGMAGTMGRWDGERWDCADLRQGDPLRDLSKADFHAVWPGEDGEMLWFGGNFFARGDNMFSLGRHGEGSSPAGISSCSP